MNERFYGSDCGCEGTQRNGAGRGTDCGCGNGAAGHYEVSGKPGRAKLLRKIQEYNFMMIETALFLNNQPCCEEAQVAFCDYQRRHAEAVAEYEACYGPLTYNGVDVKRDGWKWVNSPWPWEVEDC